MASNINPNNIDGTFPIEGINNDSQGFRTNFANASANFDAAKTEIEELQVGVELAANLGTTSGTVDIDHNLAAYQYLTTSGAITFTLSNFPTTNYGAVRVEMNITNVAHTLTLPAAATNGVDFIDGYAMNVVTFSSTGVFVFEIYTYDSVTYTVNDITRVSAASPGGATTQVQFNNTDAFDGDPMLAWTNAGFIPELAIGDGTTFAINPKVRLNASSAGTSEIEFERAGSPKGSIQYIPSVGGKTDVLRITNSVNGGPITQSVVEIIADNLVHLSINEEGCAIVGGLQFDERASAAFGTVATKGQLWVRNDTPNVLVFRDDAGTDFDLSGPRPLGINAQVGTTYVPVLSDANIMITMNNSSPNTVTIPANATVAYPIGTELHFMQLGTGTTTIAITTDTMFVETAPDPDLRDQYTRAVALKITATSWVLTGDLAPGA